MKLPPLDPALREARTFMRDHDPDPAHAAQVTAIAHQLFLQLRKFHGLGRPEHRLLIAAALLHDTGWSEAPDGRAHHKASARLIRHHKWSFFSAAEIGLIAQIARYHRRKLPSKKHPAFGRLGSGERQLVSSLASLLRMADALDRSHQSLVRQLRTDLSGKSVVITIQTSGTARDEEYAFLDKRDLFVKHFARPIELNVQRRR